MTETQPGQVVVTLEANTLPILTMATLPFDPTKIDLKSPDIYPVLGASLIKNLAQSAGGPVSGEIKPGSHVFIGGKPGYVYKATIQNQRGEEMSVELTLLTLDPGHIGMFALISVQGQAAVRGFEDIIRAATVVSP